MSNSLTAGSPGDIAAGAPDPQSETEHFVARLEAQEALRGLIAADPDLVLEDREILSTLVSAEEAGQGRNVVDLRGVAMTRLTGQLDRLEETHRTVLSAAFDTVSTTQQAHRAILALLEPRDLGTFVAALDGPVADILRVATIRIAVEAPAEATGQAAARPDGLIAVPHGFVDAMLRRGQNQTPQEVLVRGVGAAAPALYGSRTGEVRSEALLRLALGDGAAPALLAIGAAEAEHFAEGQATDLLELFGGVVERLLRGWL